VSVFFRSGEVFFGCEILAVCGRGAFGVTYLAKDPVGRKIAVKIVGSTGRCDRELQGIRNYMRISGLHPNLLRVHHIGETEEGFFYTMEAADDCGDTSGYVPATLGNLLRRSRKFTPEEAVKITRELLAGIEVMHDADLIHRDIKPDNIIFVGGVAKLSDPGLVINEGETASLAGTPGFIPPEMIESARPSDRQSDLYAIGKVFYCMITGWPPTRYPELPKEMRIEVCRQIFPALSRMCSKSPAKRFRTAAEFLEGLPEKIESPTRWERFRTDFRDWRILNPGRARALFGGIAAAVLLLIAAAAGAVGWHIRNLRLEAEQKHRIAAFLALNKDRPEVLELQMEAFVPGSLARFRELRRAVDSSRKANDSKLTASLCGELQKLLRAAAEKLLPELPAKPGELSSGLAAVAALRGFLSSPLAEYLPPERKTLRRKELVRFEKILYSGWRGPRCDRMWEVFQRAMLMPMVFVPPGAVRMRHSGKIVRIPYHFWICRDETRQEHVRATLDISPQQSPFPNTPVERISWNDVLFHCFVVTAQLKEAGELPPGYIVRPPAEAEWEYAANNAWLGPDTTPLEARAVIRSNSGNRTQIPGTKLPNKLGVCDIYGNVAEIVLPFEKPALQNAVMVRGGSYLSKPEQCFNSTPHLKYQSIPNSIGFRMVIAPGDMDYFDRHFFLNGPVQANPPGRVWELIGGNLDIFDWQRADELCGLLGGRLAEIRDQTELEFLARELPLAVQDWGCFLGGRKVNGKWKWLRSGREIDFGKWRRSPRAQKEEGDLLMLRGRSWAAGKKARACLFLCEWDEKEYPRRNDQQLAGKKLPRELARFTVADRTFMLIDSPMHWNAACRICELLGGRLACLDTPEVRTGVIERLAPWRDRRIMLGGYAKREKWFWLSGKPCELKLKMDWNYQIPSRNLNHITLRNGEFYDSWNGQLFLCEWPNSKPHPRISGTPR